MKKLLILGSGTGGTIIAGNEPLYRSLKPFPGTQDKYENIIIHS